MNHVQMWKLHFQIQKTQNVDCYEESYFKKTHLFSNKSCVHLTWREGLRAEHPAETCGDPHASANVATRRMSIAGAH